MNHNNSTPPRPRRLLVIHNPVAGSRRRRRFAATLEALAAWGCAVTVRQTAARGDAEALARAAVGAADVIVAAGGDGTINEVANGIGDARVPLGIIPLGTANVLAAEIGLALAPAAVALVLAAALPRQIHAGIVNGRRFLMMAGVGFDARVVERVHPQMKRRLGKAAYVLRAVQALLAPRLTRYAVEIDGVRTSAASIVIAKGKSYGGPFVLAPRANLGVPEFEACLLSSGSRAALLAVAGGLATARTESVAALQRTMAKELLIAGPQGDPVQADGDIVARLPVSIRPAPTPLALLAP